MVRKTKPKPTKSKRRPIFIRLTLDEHARLTRAAGPYLAPTTWAKAALLRAIDNALKKKRR